MICIYVLQVETSRITGTSSTSRVSISLPAVSALVLFTCLDSEDIMNFFFSD